MAFMTTTLHHHQALLIKLFHIVRMMNVWIRGQELFKSDFIKELPTALQLLLCLKEMKRTTNPNWANFFLEMVKRSEIT